MKGNCLETFQGLFCRAAQGQIRTSATELREASSVSMIETTLTVKTAGNGNRGLPGSEKFNVMVCCPLVGLQQIPSWMGWAF